jgi:hypothetical protein
MDRAQTERPFGETGIRSLLVDDVSGLAGFLYPGLVLVSLLVNDVALDA